MVLKSIDNLCFEQKYEKYQFFFLSENFQILEVKFSIYLNRRVFVMIFMLASFYFVHHVSKSCRAVTSLTW